MPDGAGDELTELASPLPARALPASVAALDAAPPMPSPAAAAIGDAPRWSASTRLAAGGCDASARVRRLPFDVWVSAAVITLLSPSRAAAGDVDAMPDGTVASFAARDAARLVPFRIPWADRAGHILEVMPRIIFCMEARFTPMTLAIASTSTRLHDARWAHKPAALMLPLPAADSLSAAPDDACEPSTAPDGASNELMALASPSPAASSLSA